MPQPQSPHPVPPPPPESLDGAPAAAKREASQAAIVADTIERAGLSGVATVFLETVKPLAWVGAQVLYVIQPIFEGLGVVRPHSDSGSLPRMAEFLEREGSVDEVIERLDASSKGRVR